MKRKALGLVSALALAAALAACSTTTGGFQGGASMTPPAIAPAPGPEAVDIHTYARPEIARVVDVALDLTANFEAKTLSGTATLDVLAAPGAVTRWICPVSPKRVVIRIEPSSIQSWKPAERLLRQRWIEARSAAGTSGMPS